MCAGFSRNADVNFKRIYIEKAFSVDRLPPGIPIFHIRFFAVKFVFGIIIRRRCLTVGIPVLAVQLVAVFIFQ